MKYTSHFPLGIVIPLLACSVPLQAAENMTEQSTPDESAATAENHEETMVITAAGRTCRRRACRPSPQKRSANIPARDVSELIRTQPGVNLTGNSTSGQRGNNRQIDIRGMGPKNTLVLVDGKPVTSRNSVRYGWRGDRDSRGDTSWVPAEMIDHIDVIRGPAAARYGNGAMGGSLTS
nr:Enterobactin outer-membrane receptor [Klebsiella pneumoniae]